jgi:hypothetical protein
MGSTVLVGSKERLVPLVELLGLREELLKLCVDDLGNWSGERLGEAVEGLAEFEELEVERRVGRVDRMCSRKALQGQQVLVCHGTKSVIRL